MCNNINLLKTLILAIDQIQNSNRIQEFIIEILLIKCSKMYDCLSGMHAINCNTADMGDPCVGFCDGEFNYIRFWLG